MVPALPTAHACPGPLPNTACSVRVVPDPPSVQVPLGWREPGGPLLTNGPRLLCGPPRHPVNPHWCRCPPGASPDRRSAGLCQGPQRPTPVPSAGPERRAGCCLVAGVLPAPSMVHSCGEKRARTAMLPAARTSQRVRPSLHPPTQPAKMSTRGRLGDQGDACAGWIVLGAQRSSRLGPPGPPPPAPAQCRGLLAESPPAGSPPRSCPATSLSGSRGGPSSFWHPPGKREARSSMIGKISHCAAYGSSRPAEYLEWIPPRSPQSAHYAPLNHINAAASTCRGRSGSRLQGGAEIICRKRAYPGPGWVPNSLKAERSGLNHVEPWLPVQQPPGRCFQLSTQSYRSWPMDCSVSLLAWRLHWHLEATTSIIRETLSGANLCRWTIRLPRESRG